MRHDVHRIDERSACPSGVYCASGRSGLRAAGPPSLRPRHSLRSALIAPPAAAASAQRGLRPSGPSPPHTELADRLGELRTPTLILWGEKDKLRGLPAARIFAARIPGSKLVSYPGVGHVPMEEIPERSAADALEFLTANG